MAVIDMSLEKAKNAIMQASKELLLPGYPVGSITGDLEPSEYLIKGICNKGDVSMLFGDSGSMKSFVELDKIMHLALGWNWHGHRINKPYGTLIVLGEGAGGYKKRVRAFMQHYNLLDQLAPIPIWIVDRAAELYSNPLQLRGWIHQAEDMLQYPIDLISIDTFNTNMGSGGDENDATVVGSMLGFAQEAAEGRAMDYIHHVGHGAKDRERGSYAIRGNMDNRTLIKRDEDGKGRIITVESLKVKDGECFKPFNLTYEVIKIGVDVDGDDVTSLVMAATMDEPKSDKKPIQRGNKRIDILLQLLRSNNGRMGYRQLRDAYKEKNPNDAKNFATGVRLCFAEGYIHDFQPMGDVIMISNSSS